MNRETVVGVVDRVEFTPGRADGLLTLSVRGQPRPVNLITGDAESAGSWAGEPVTAGGPNVPLLVLLAEHPARVVLDPMSDRYGAALKADFTPET
jgi:hypothetical protein